MSLDPDTREWLANRFGANVQFDEPMSRHTYFRVGGPADAFVRPASIAQLVELVQWSRNKGVPCLVIGDGANLLVKDKGIRGIVTVLTRGFKKITAGGRDKAGVHVDAMAGARLRALCAFAIKQGLGGMNFALGIPGTVGGGIMMNAGTAEGAMENVVVSLKALWPAGEIITIEKPALDFRYRRFIWPREPDNSCPGLPVILEGRFCLQPSDSEALNREAQKIMKTRKKRQPTHLPSAGCIFRNPSSAITAGQLIDKAGLKGRKIGDAEISSKHANFIVNTGKASAADILALMDVAQESVSKIFSIELEPEVKIIGI